MAQIELRRAVLEDMEKIFRWRNLPEIVQRGSTQRTIPWEEHQRWFKQTIERQDRLLMIILFDGEEIGQVRFDQEGQDALIGMYLTPGRTGRGLGTIAFRYATMEAFAAMPIRRIVGYIRKDNAPCIASIRKAGYQESPEGSANPPADDCSYQILRPSQVPHNRLTHGREEVEEVCAVVESGRWACGPKILELESELARMAGVRHAVCVASGMSALRLAMKGLGVGAGDRVLVPAYSCVALANAALALGAQPIPIDVAGTDWNLDEDAALRQARDCNPRAAIAINLFGAPAAISRLRSQGVPLIEDCAHAFGMEVDGKPLGSRCGAAILSFYATKLISAGEGGAVLTDSDDLANFVRSWRDYGDQPADGSHWNDKMSDVEAALALCQLKRLPAMIADRERLAARYHEALAPEAQAGGLFRLPEFPRRRLWYRYAVESLKTPADSVIEAMARYDVCAAKPVEDWRAGDAPPCPVADRAYRHIVSLPLYPTLTAMEQDRVIYAFLKAVRSASNV
ncbi:MAG: GNAT family N-acetyltransferase [Candidatus Sumerlaeota bacterium]|nr:GNAT family N-acetyltransferase [Candidatus Sumerlaeota bacterium]